MRFLLGVFLAPLLVNGCTCATSPSSLPPTPTSAVCTNDHAPTSLTTPLETGRSELVKALADAKLAGSICVATIDDPTAEVALHDASQPLDPRPESFAVARRGDATWVVGSDAAGAMYGAFELAERLRAGAAELPVASSFAGTPVVAVRGANLFLTLPAPNEAAWWFTDEGFWTEYLDLLARARMNFLDLHGMYDLASTIFPNALLYFGTSASFPGVGAPAATRDANVAMLATIVRMAKARGIAVGLMSYRADLSLDGTSPPEESLSEGDRKRYTREAVADLARRVPGLARVGFRIGESVEPAQWYVDTFIAGVRDASPTMALTTRTWGATKSDIDQLAAVAGPGFFVEAKYNGEHLASPYPIAGGKMAAWHNYSYEDYLEPPAPYGFVFQVRAGGTHRIFRQASLARARRAATTFTLSGARGFTFEAPHAYLPQRDFYHSPADVFAPYVFRRDELTYLLYGRLAYDPAAPERAFRAALAARVGTDALWDAVQAASDIVPWIQSAHTCGPDQRDFAPELELGGPVAYWAAAADAKAPPHACGHYHGPFDDFAIAGPIDEAADLVASKPTARLAPSDVAAIVLADVEAARTAASAPIDPKNAEARDVVRECLALADLGEHFAHKLRAATALAVYAKTADAAWLTGARAEATAADDAWTKLAKDTAYIAPFDENMRMRPLQVAPFHWRAELPRLADDAASIDALVKSVTAAPPSFHGALPPFASWLAKTRAIGTSVASIAVAPSDPKAASWTVGVHVAPKPAAGSELTLLWKPFSGLTDWARAPLTAKGDGYEATIQGTGAGALFAVEITGATDAIRLPDVREETPYVALPPQ